MRALVLIAMIAVTAYAPPVFGQATNGSVPDEAKPFLTDDEQKLRPASEVATSFKNTAPDKRRKLEEMCADGSPTGKSTHALIELCAWIGQYR